MVAEIRVMSRKAIVPVFRVPLRGPAEEQQPVRHRFRLVDPIDHNTNRSVEIEALPMDLATTGRRCGR